MHIFIFPVTTCVTLYCLFCKLVSCNQTHRLYNFPAIDLHCNCLSFCSKFTFSLFLSAVVLFSIFLCLSVCPPFLFSFSFSFAFFLTLILSVSFTARPINNLVTSCALCPLVITSLSPVREWKQVSLGQWVPLSYWVTELLSHWVTISLSLSSSLSLSLSLSPRIHTCLLGGWESEKEEGESYFWKIAPPELACIFTSQTATYPLVLAWIFLPFLLSITHA